MSTKLIELGKVTAETKGLIIGGFFDNETGCLLQNRNAAYVA